MDILLRQRLLIFISIYTLGVISPFSSYGSVAEWLKVPEKLSTKTSWSGCPSQTAGKFVLELVKNFEKTKSLFSLDKVVKEKKLDKKYFISNYKISFSPFLNKLSFKLECPKALVRVSAINESGKVVSSSILVHKGQLFDPTYEILLKSEKILKSDLPTLAISYEKLTESYKNILTSFFSSLDKKTKSMLSELIVDSSGKMTLILSHQRKPTSVFFGEDEWIDKREKLTRMIKYLVPKKGLPKTINMSNSKKVVVKF